MTYLDRLIIPSDPAGSRTMGMMNGAPSSQRRFHGHGRVELGFCAFIPPELNTNNDLQPSPGSLARPAPAQAKTFHCETLKLTVCQEYQTPYLPQIPRQATPHSSSHDPILHQPLDAACVTLHVRILWHSALVDGTSFPHLRHGDLHRG